MINKLKLEHFKAFREPAELVLDGKNVLVYGENGAGKSSLYQALKIIFHRKWIFDSQIAPTVTDPRDRRNAEKDVLEQYNYQLTPLTDFTLEIDNADYKAYTPSGIDVSMISRDDIHAEDVIDVVKLLQKSIVGIADPEKFVTDKKKTIEDLLNLFLKEYFYEEKLTVELTYSRPNWLLTVKDSSRDNRGRNEKLTEYFNEAKLHIIKLLLLLTAVLYNDAVAVPGVARVLVLDDVISSMDAANRTMFIELLADFFKDYQRIIFTHSISFFNLAEYVFSTVHQQRDEWRRFQIVEHQGNSEVVERDSQDFARNIKSDYSPGRNEGTIGNRIRKRFEFLAGEVSKLICAGGIAESGQILRSILAPKKLYYEYDRANKKLHTIYDMVDELTAIIDADSGCQLKTRLDNVVGRYVSGSELGQLRDTLCEMMVYQKVTMHPLSHATGAMPLSTQTEVERSITLLNILEGQLNSLIGRDLYSI
uniref:AAA family ATPase n=1 Tax=Candidatus Cryptobacteroides bacterium TaxID=3085639 RepID=UPI0040260DC1